MIDSRERYNSMDLHDFQATSMLDDFSEPFKC